MQPSGERIVSETTVDATETLHATTSQTVGPYLQIGLAPRYVADIAFDGSDDAADGARITVSGRVIDGAGDALPDAMIEIWQADARGRYAHPHDPSSGHAEDARTASGFGRLPTEPDGGFRFTTVKPGRVRAPDGSLQAPHLIVAVFARGLLRHLSTRVYFDDEAAANADDFVLAKVPAERRRTLVAAADGAGGYRWDVVLQGAADRETVFFDF